jgi:hypothetical protein
MSEFEPSISLPLAHVTVHRAILAAREYGATTWIKNAAGAPVAAIVPRGVAELGLAEWKKQRHE